VVVWANAAVVLNSAVSARTDKIFMVILI
jgi:hypothetical protein